MPLRNTLSIPQRSGKAWPPASTTPAFFSTGSRSGVSSKGVGCAHAGGVHTWTRVTAQSRPPAPLACHPGHSEDGALRGLHHGLEASSTPRSKRPTSAAPTASLPCQALGNAPEQQDRMTPGCPGPPEHGGEAQPSLAGGGDSQPSEPPGGGGRWSWTYWCPCRHRAQGKMFSSFTCFLYLEMLLRARKMAFSVENLKSEVTPFTT